MAQQTGSISFEATNAFSSYASGEYATKETATRLQTAIEQNAENITLRATKAELDALSIGGRNYILNSASISASGIGSASGSRKEYQLVNVGQSYMDVPSGTQVTLSFDLYMTVNTANPSLMVYNTNNKGPKQFHGVTLWFTAAAGTTISKRVSVTEYISDRDNPTLSDNYLEFYSGYGTSNWFSIKNLKLELGNRATDWSPAPEDMATAAELKVANDAITLRATKEELNSLSIGGRNRLVNTENPTADNPVKGAGCDAPTVYGGTVAYSNGVGTYTSVGDAAERYIRYIPISGDTLTAMGLPKNGDYVFSGYVKTSFDDAQSRLTVRSQYYVSSWKQVKLKNLLTGEELSGGSIPVIVGSSSEWARFEVMVTIPDGESPTNFYLSLQEYNKDGGATVTAGDTFQFKSLKFEKGSKATDWSPAPEDMATAAELKVANDQINLRVEKSGVISSINQSAESIKITADKVAIDGTAVFSAIKGQADAAYDAKGAAATVQDNLDNLQVGGRNLLRGTGDYATWDPSGPAVEYSLVRTDEYIKFVPPTNATWWSIEPHDAFIPVDEWDKSSSYTVSVDVKFDNLKTSPTHPSVAVETVTDKRAGYDLRVDEKVLYTVPTTDNWTHFEQTFSGDYSTWNHPGSGTPAYVKAIIWLYVNSSNVDAVYIRNLKLEKGTKPTDWSPAPEDVEGAIDSVYEKVRSQGIQLVTNGNGFMGDNTNWPALTFDGTKSNGSPGSFTKSVGYADVMADEMFPIDVSKEYLLEFDAMSDGGTGILYSCMCCYDVDGNSILAQNVLYYPNTLTTLAKDLNPGDTTVTLTSATNWVNTSADHQRSLVFWDYENSYGYTYPPETYTRNYYSGVYADDGKVNKSTGVITLKRPWTGVKKAKGTYVSQGHSGGTYVYAHANVKVPSEWTHYSAVFSGLDLDKDGIDTAGKFRQGTAFAKVGFLWNYNSHISSQGQIWVTNISVKEATASSSESVKRTQRIYYRSDSATKPATPSAWVTKEDDGTGAWTKMHVAITSTHKYIYTCEQSEKADGTLGHTTVLRDNTITVIDGGNVITHSIVADKLDADSVKANIVQTTTILAEQMKTNLLHAMDAVVSDLKAINATIGGFAIDDTSIRSGALNSTASGAVALAKSAFSRAINGTARSLMLAIGSKFGVGSDGTLYASGATVDGTVTATAGTIGGASIVDGVLKVKDANVDGKISANHLDVSSIKIGDLSGSIGGRNLLLQTGSMFPRSGTSSGYFIEFTVSNGLLKNSYELDEGVEYTFSADVTSSRDGFQITVGAGSGGFSKDVATKYGLSSGHVILTFTPTAAQLASGKVFAFRAPRYSTQGTSFTYSVDNVKLEKGSKATDWTPAPEDQTAYVDSISIGGRNLLVGSSTGHGWSYTSFNAQAVEYTRGTTAVGESYVTAPPMTFEPGQEYTLSCYVKSNGYVKNLDLYKVHQTGGGSHQQKQGIALTTEYQRVVWTFTCNATEAETAYIRFDNNGSKASGTNAILYVKEPKLEKGGKATDWTPAPEDVDESISDAAKTATTYLTEGTSNGLMVHRSSDATTGVRITDNVDILRNGVMVTKLGDDGMTLYDGTVTTVHAIIAQFTKEAVLLGLTASKPTIWLGGRDHALIQEDDGALSLGANSVSLNALNSRASLSTTYITIESSNSENNKKARLSLFHDNTLGDWSGSAAYLDAERVYLNADTFINGTLTLYTPLADINIDSVSTSKLTGTIADSNLPTKGSAGTAGTSSATSGATLAVPYVTTDAYGRVTAKGTHTHTIGSLAASAVTSGEFDVARIPNLEASKINAGTFDAARIPSLNASKINAGTFDAARIPNLNASKINAGTLDSARLPTVPIDKGGTGQTGVEKTTDIAAAMSAASGVTISAAQVATWGKVMQVLITAKATAAKSGTWTVGTMTAGHRPELVTFGTSNLAAIEQCRMGTDGAVSVAGTLAANASVSLTFTYLLA